MKYRVGQAWKMQGIRIGQISKDCRRIPTNYLTEARIRSTPNLCSRYRLSTSPTSRACTVRPWGVESLFSPPSSTIYGLMLVRSPASGLVNSVRLLETTSSFNPTYRHSTVFAKHYRASADVELMTVLTKREASTSSRRNPWYTLSSLLTSARLSRYYVHDEACKWVIVISGCI
jgi:hypothetical protein